MVILMNNTYEKVHIGQVVSDDGVILHDIYEGDRYISKEQTEYIQNNYLNFKKGAAFTKVLIDADLLLFKKLTIREYAIASILKSFIDYQDGYLKYNKKIVDIKTLSEILEENYDTFRKTITSLEKKGVLSKQEIQSDTYANKTKICIVLNPYIFFRGKDVNKWIADLFKNTEWAKL